MFLVFLVTIFEINVMFEQHINIVSSRIKNILLNDTKMSQFQMFEMFTHITLLTLWIYILICIQNA